MYHLKLLHSTAFLYVLPPQFYQLLPARDGLRMRVCYVQVVVHDGDVQADVVHAVGWDVEDNGLIVGGIQRVFLYARLLLFQTSPITYEGHLDIRI